MDSAELDLFIKLSGLSLREIIRCHAEMAHRKAPRLEEIEDAVSPHLDRWISWTIDEALRAEGLEVHHIPEAFRFPGFIIRGELDCSARRIIISNPVMDELKELLVSLPVNLCAPAMLDKMVKAHEFFHYLEYGNGKKEGDFPGEVGAHLFSMRLLGLSFYPWILDSVQILHRHGDALLSGTGDGGAAKNGNPLNDKKDFQGTSHNIRGGIIHDDFR